MPDGGRVALITGGTRGIGLGIARSLAAEGLDLALCGLRSRDEVRPVLDELRGRGREVIYETADVGSREERERLMVRVRERLGRLHVLVNNAGMSSLDRGLDLLDAREQSFERLLRVNLQGPYFLTRAAARWMLDQRESDPSHAGCIVNVSSVSATVVSVNRGDYCVAKAGLSMATRVWAARLAEHGIPVYEVRPGLIRSDMTAPAREKYDALIEGGLLPQARWGEPEDVGRAVAALVRGDLPYSTGHALAVDGGLTVQRL
jgi:NAD(P)-dependent dehydrogenase (short-subunit alcohol dehydrogenase family)